MVLLCKWFSSLFVNWVYNNLIERQEKYSTIYFESKARAFGLVAVGALLLALTQIYPSVWSDVGFVFFLRILAVVIGSIGLVSLLYPAASVSISENSLKYKRGKIEWQAGWDELSAIYQVGPDVLIETNKGFSKLINLPILKKKGSKSTGIASYMSPTLNGFLRNIIIHRNQSADEFVECLERYSGKKALQYSMKGWEKIRKT